jgi:23S rRNA (cytidine1920-2'-O)/16S rRNA (cytidine1409-2'-O)-methyltransferase
VLKGLRLDERVVRDGLAATRTRAQALIRSGRVLVDDVPVEKPGTRVREGAALRVRGEERAYVSRGGDKLAGALTDLGIDPRGLACLDLGASTGGFTDCLLRAGADRVVAVDVGYGQLDAGLRSDPRVLALERTNVRHMEASAVPAPIDLVTIDVSFISATLLLPRLPELAPGADVLVLAKPQFEVGRSQVEKGGVVRDEALRVAAADRVRGCAESLGYRLKGRVDSRIPGPKGNREIFLWFRPAASPRG